jgi:hypothetical protein
VVGRASPGRQKHVRERFPQWWATSSKHPVVGEPCRMRKTRCDISEKPVCSECVRRGRSTACVLRTKARVKRYGNLSRGHTDGEVGRSATPQKHPS